MPGPSKPVWSKRVDPAGLSEHNIGYCAGADVRGRPAADRRLAFHDLCTNAAHLLMLVERGIVAAKHGAALARGLGQLFLRHEAGEELLRPECEDIHMSIEAALTSITGSDAGGRLHTARSRNDQVATDMRLWLRHEVLHTAGGLLDLAASISAHARLHAETACPGFTHMQPAMVTSWGHWTASYIPRVLRIVRQLLGIHAEAGGCPLGAAASFGTGWPIDRASTARWLGFEAPTASGADGVWSRGELEARYAFTAAQLMGHLSGIGQDLILLSTPPRQWLRLAGRHTTGSSIMPQKRNPDFAEVTRARAAQGAGIAQSLLALSIGLPSGYNRDTQWTKYLVFDAADNVEGAAELFADVFSGLTVDAKSMSTECDTGFLVATDVADFLASSRGIPFRDAYKILGAAVHASEEIGRLTRAALNDALGEEQIGGITAGEWETLNEPALLLARRDQYGNPAPKRTMEMLDGFDNEASSLRGRVEAAGAARRESLVILRAALERLGESSA